MQVATYLVMERFTLVCRHQELKSASLFDMIGVTVCTLGRLGSATSEKHLCTYLLFIL